MFLSRCIPRLSDVATSPASLHRFASTARPLLTASATLRWRPARRFSASFPAATSPSRRVYRFPSPYRFMSSNTGVKGEENVDNVDTINGAEDERTASGDEHACTTTLEVVDSKPVTSRETVDITGSKLSSVDKDSWDPMKYVPAIEIFPDSSHRDGSIYSGTAVWKEDYRIAEPDETWMEPMMFSDPTDCRVHDGTCESHTSRDMLQFLSLRLAKVPEESGSVELYGYIAVRDNLNPLLNYIVNFSRNDPITVKQGFLINMADPKRGIELVGTILIEYDMKIKVSENEKEDLQVIDGVSLLDNIDTWDRSPFTFRIHGDCGAIDVCVSRLNFAYEATIEVVISQVQSNFSMRLGSFTSGLHEEIPLFDGAIGESCGLERSVVAVVSEDQMELKFKVAADLCIPVEYCVPSMRSSMGALLKR